MFIAKGQFLYEALLTTNRFLALRNFQLSRPNVLVEVLALIIHSILHDDNPSYAFLAEQLLPFISDDVGLPDAILRHGHPVSDISDPARVRPSEAGAHAQMFQTMDIDDRERILFRRALANLSHEMHSVFTIDRFGEAHCDDWFPKSLFWCSTQTSAVQFVAGRTLTIVEMCMLAWMWAMEAARFGDASKWKLVHDWLQDMHPILAAIGPPKSRIWRVLLTREIYLAPIKVLHRWDENRHTFECMHPSRAHTVTHSEYVALYLFKEPHLDAYTAEVYGPEPDGPIVWTLSLNPMSAAIVTRGTSSDYDIYRPNDEPVAGQPNVSDLLWILKRFALPCAVAFGEISAVLIECTRIVLLNAGPEPDDTMYQCIAASEAANLDWLKYGEIHSLIRARDLVASRNLRQIYNVLTSLYDFYTYKGVNFHPLTRDLLTLVMCCVETSLDESWHHWPRSENVLGALDLFWGRAYARARQSESWFRAHQRDPLIWEPLRIRHQVETLVTLDRPVCIRCGADTTMRCYQCGTHYCSKHCLERDWSVHVNSSQHAWAVSMYNPDPHSVAAGILTDENFRDRWAKRFRDGRAVVR